MEKENRIVERRIEEKIYCHEYDSLVREMAKSMEVDEAKIYPTTEGEFNYEDINSWISAVGYKDNKSPDIEFSISSDKGKSKVSFETLKMEGVKQSDKETTKEELLYSMALTEAKMKVVKEIAEDTYPAVSYQIEDYRKQMEQVREEVLNNKENTDTLDEILNRVVSRRGMLVATGLVISSLILSSCGIGTQPVEGYVPTSTRPNKATATEVFTKPLSTKTAEPTTTPTKTATPTEVMTPTEIIKYPEFSRYYQPEFKQNYVAEVYGMKIPVDIGLLHWVIARKDTPVKELYLTSGYDQLVAEAFLRSCHYRFTHLMKGNEDVSFDEYIELVKQGKGNIEMMAYMEGNGPMTLYPKLGSFDPRNGFSLSLVDTQMPIKLNPGASYYQGITSEGKLVSAQDFSSKTILSYLNDHTMENESVAWDTLVLSRITFTLKTMSTLENSCLEYADPSVSCSKELRSRDDGTKWFIEEVIRLYDLNHTSMVEIVQ